jgi:hypothetical protein
LVAASEAAAAARRRVRRLVAVALLGGPHDPDRLDTAILDQRRAQHMATTTLGSWARWHRRHRRHAA